MESSLKEGNLKDKTILLNITIPSSVAIITCQIKNKILKLNIILNCQNNDLNQENRIIIINGIKIEGIIKNNFTDEKLIAENNAYSN